MVLRARTEPSPQRAKYCGWSGTSSRLLYSRLRNTLSGAFIDPAALLPRLSPQAHRLLARAVREREQDRFRPGLDLERIPRRHDETVARLELEFLAADLHAGAAFDGREHHAVGAAVRLRLVALGQELDERGDRRHGVAAGERVDVFHLPAMAGVGRLVLRELGERFAAALVRVIEDRRSLAERRAGPERHEPLAEARHRGAFAARHRLHLLRKHLVELRREGLHDADIEAVHPYHGLIPRVAVVVPGPRRGDDEVARAHRGALAIDRGIGTRALHDEAQRRLGMTVARCDLARQDELQAGVEALRHARLAAHARVLEDEHAPDRFLRGDELARLHEIGP